MNAWYVGIVDYEDGVFGIWFPDFIGCISAGDTFSEILANGEAALNFHVAGLRQDGDAIPEPRALDAILEDDDLSEWIGDAAKVLIPLHPPVAIAAE